MNVADSPEIAVRFGSASVRITPAFSIARMVAVTDGSCDKRSACDRAGNLGGCIGAFVAANEAVACGRRRPGLPLKVSRRDRLAEADVGLRNEDVLGWQLCNRRGGRLVVGPACEIRGDAAGTDSDSQDDNACCIHTLHFPHGAATLPPR